MRATGGETVDGQFGDRLPNLDHGLDSVSTAAIIDSGTFDIAEEHPVH